MGSNMAKRAATPRWPACGTRLWYRRLALAECHSEQDPSSASDEAVWLFPLDLRPSVHLTDHSAYPAQILDAVAGEARKPPLRGIGRSALLSTPPDRARRGSLITSFHLVTWPTFDWINVEFFQERPEVFLDRTVQKDGFD